MKMNRSVLSALLALGMAACADSTPALQIGNVTAQGADCSVDASSGPGLLRGSLDLNLRNPALGFPLVVGVTSNLQNATIEVGDRPVTGDGSSNAIYITHLKLGYSSSTQGMKFTEPNVSVPVYGTITDGGNLLISLFTGQALADLVAFVNGGAGAADVLVKIKFQGETVTGDELESNEISFPVIVYKGNFSCPTGQTPAPSDEECPQTGLNGAVPTCE